MSRLILFSGGVESTALLTQAKKDDIVITIRDTSPENYYTYHPERIEKIADVFGLKILYTDLSIPIKKEKKFVYQLWTFIPVAMIWASRFPQITEVWYGLNKGEPSDIAKPDFNQCKKIWSTAFSDIKLKFPFGDLTKKQQWDMIPFKAQALITTCLYNNFCGQCRKCKELNKLKGIF